MSTFTCAHHDVPEDWCQLLKTDCVPGRPGCVLRGKSVFLVPVEERIREKEQARRARALPMPPNATTDHTDFLGSDPNRTMGASPSG